MEGGDREDGMGAAARKEGGGMAQERDTRRGEEETLKLLKSSRKYVVKAEPISRN